MPQSAKMPKSPAGLGREGRQLWREIVTELAETGLELTARERKWLLDAARETDLAAELEKSWRDDGSPMTTLGSAKQLVIHPVISEIRQHRETCARLLGRLDLTDDTAAGANAGHRYDSTAARAAAQTRWARRG